jgi:ankyrin repeat protein
MLLAAANYGHVDVVRFLIEEVGVPSLGSKGQCSQHCLTALHLACRGGDDAVVAVLLGWERMRR